MSGLQTPNGSISDQCPPESSRLGYTPTDSNFTPSGQSNTVCSTLWNSHSSTTSPDGNFHIPGVGKEGFTSRRSSGGMIRDGSRYLDSGGTSNGSSGTGRKGKGAHKETEAPVTETEAEAKRRKVQRACDVCRRKKIRCEGPMTSASASKCAHCEEYHLDCTYVEAAKRRGPPKGYVETLEQRCGRMERLLQQLYPGVDFTSSIGPPPDRDEFDLASYQHALQHLKIPPYPAVKTFTLPLTRPSSLTTTDNSPSSAQSPGENGLAAVSSSSSLCFDRCKDPSQSDIQSDEIDGEYHDEIASAMKKLDVKDSDFRYHGKASGAHLFRAVNDLKFPTGTKNSVVAFLEGLETVKRSEYWDVLEWEKSIGIEGFMPVDQTIWPRNGLDETLIDAYFKHVNLTYPLLNRIIFRRQYASGLYKTDHDFAKVCLMVFANGAQFVDDPQVYWSIDEMTSAEGQEQIRANKGGMLRYSAGYKYLRMILRMGKSWLKGPTLADLQVQVLICAFLMGSTIPHLPWLASGIGLRAAQEMGIHVRATLIRADPVERALLMRAFWCLYHIDRIACAGIGRSVAIQDCDFDAEYPVAVDDEFWETGDPETDFKQPESAGVPAMAAFVHILKLDHIIGAILRTIYAINKPSEHPGDTVGQRAIVVELDSALNSWADSVPEGLRWDPSQEDDALFTQSATLYAYYYYTQILIHRTYIPTPKHPSTTGLPSLAICCNASRSICNILDAKLRRGQKNGTPPGQIFDISLLLPAITAAIVLLISVHLGKLQKAERERTMADVRRCIEATKEMEVHWRQAGKMTDILMELSRETGSPAETTAKVEPHGTKRTHSDGEEEVLIHGIAESPSVNQNSQQINFENLLNSNRGPTLHNVNPSPEPMSRVSTPPPVFGLNSCNRHDPVGGLSLPAFPYSPEFNSMPNMFFDNAPHPNLQIDPQQLQSQDALFNPNPNPIEAFYSDYALGTFDFPAVAAEAENDVWAQLFAGYQTSTQGWNTNQQSDN